jgi:phospholipid transport system substrate-binding protein
MSLLKRILFTACAALLPFAGGALAQSAAAAAPDALIRDLSAEVLAAIRTDPQLAKGDPVRVEQVVDEKVLPHVDFRKMTRMAVGRGWRDATPEQRDALTREFHQLLIRTYSGALSQVRDHQVQLRPFRAQPNEKDVVVRTNIVASGSEPVQIDYRLEKTDAGWKIYDVNILGVWLVENYRTQFASEINARGVDGLIKTLSDRNRQLSQQPAKKA